MPTFQFDVGKFDGKNYFNLWREKDDASSCNGFAEVA